MNIQKTIKGFTLVEVLIAVTILAVLLVMGVPEFQKFLVNRAVRSATDSLYSGLQVARANAIRTNNPTVFRLVPVGGTALSVKDSNATSGGMATFPNGGWEVFQVVPTASGAGSTTLEAVESWSGVQSSITLTANPATGVAVTFDSLGRVRATNDVSANSNLNIGVIDVTPNLGDPSRGVYPLRVEVSFNGVAGGSIRTCAPHLSSTDTKACRSLAATP
jgi:type IV fimbrial biogenesis protein FimT